MRSELRLMYLLTLFAASAVAYAANADLADADLADAARTVMALDSTPTLITIDASGQPRARTVQASNPDADFTLWIATKPNTRKVTQLRANDRVTLHYAKDADGVYVSVMGRATLHDDPETLRDHSFHSESDLAAFWPDYPDDYLLIRIAAERVEVLGGGAAPDAVTWAPQGFAP